MNPSNQVTGNPNFFGQKVSKPGINVQTAGPQDLVYSNDYTTTTYYDNSNSRILLGQLPDGTYGIWVSKPGFNVTDTNAVASNELILNSNQDVLKVAASGDITINVNATGNFTGTATHTLGVTPAILCYLTGVPTVAAGRWFTVPYVQADATSGMTILAVFDASVDNTTVHIDVFNNNAFAEGLYTFKYYLLEETLS